MMERCAIKSWQIYNENEGATFKIRFGPCNNTSTSGVDSANIHYTKKSASRSARDLKRSRNHTKTTMVTRSQKKKVEGDATELARCMDMTGEPPLLFSPEPVVQPTNTDDCYSSDLDISLPVMSPGQNNQDTPTQSTQVHTLY